MAALTIQRLWLLLERGVSVAESIEIALIMISIDMLKSPPKRCKRLFLFHFFLLPFLPPLPIFSLCPPPLSPVIEPERR